MMGVAAPSEFNLDSVRQLMLAHGGRVTNHDLVKSFRRWLTDPAIKEQSRLQFKDYVNTLATIKLEDGEKYLVLKRKYFPEYYSDRNNAEAINQKQFQEFYTNNPEQIYESSYGGALIPQPGGGFMPPPGGTSGSPSLMDEVMASFTPPSKTIGRQPTSLAPKPSALVAQPTSLPPHRPSYPTTNGSNSISNIPAHHQYNNSAQYSRNTDDIYSRQGSQQDLRYSRQPSQDASQGYQDPSFHRQSSQDLIYQKQSLQELGYQKQISQDLIYQKQLSQDLTYQRQNSQDLKYTRQDLNSGKSSNDLRGGYSRETGLYSAAESGYNDARPYSDQRSSYSESRTGGSADPRISGSADPRISGSVDPRTGYRETAEDSYNPGAFSAHFNPSSRQSVSSLASLTSSGSYHGSPRSSYATAPSYPTGSSRNPSISMDSRLLPPDPRGSGGHTSGSPRGIVSAQDQLSNGRKNAPPPYRPPPVDPPPPPRTSSATRPTVAPPPRPTDGYISPPPIDRRNSYAASVSSVGSDLPQRLDRPTRLDINPPDLGLPPTPPRRPEFSQDHNPPPLPRRPPPLGGESSPTGLPKTKNQNARTSDLDLPISLSKSYGNLTIDDNKENRLGGSVSVDNLTKENESISVRERTKTFNRMASDTEISSMSGSTLKLSMVKRRNSRAVDMGSRRGSAVSRDDDSQDTASITTLDPSIKSWMIQVSKDDYQSIARMLMDEPKLARNKDFTTGYTGLHWAAKYGNLDMIKLLAGTYNANPNVRSHGGYTPLHLAAQHGHQGAFDLLVQAYRADANLRDYAGKRPRQYMMQADNSTHSLSNHTFRQLKDRRRTRANKQHSSSGMLRFGSLSVKVKKTTEAFNNYFNNNADANKKWTSSSSTTSANPDLQNMPPPKFAPIKKRKNSKRGIDFGLSKSAPGTPAGRVPAAEVIPEERCSDNSDSEFGFGNTWSNA